MLNFRTSLFSVAIGTGAPLVGHHRQMSLSAKPQVLSGAGQPTVEASWNVPPESTGEHPEGLTVELLQLSLVFGKVSPTDTPVTVRGGFFVTTRSRSCLKSESQLFDVV